MNDTKIKKLVLAALFAAICYITTTIVKIPSPTNGYIHPGDGFVLLSGILLGPLYGGLAAGIGSMLSDLLSGYMVYVPATLVIKGLCAVIAALLFHRSLLFEKRPLIHNILTCIIAEAVMVIGYFLFETALSLASGSLLSAALLYGASGIGFNIIQGIAGTIVAVALTPVLRRVLPLAS